jgi:homogentisate 1,2-dioxygenase
MVDQNRITPVFPLIKGKTSKQAHTGFENLNDGKPTYEHEHGRQGFFGKVSHLYHVNPPTNFVDVDDGDFKPYMVDTTKLQPTDQKDPEGSPITFIENSELKIRISRRSEPMPFYYKSTDTDDLWFVHKGKGKFETLYGPFTFEPGDYIIIPRGTIYRVVPETTDNFFLLLESKEEINIPNRGMLGPNALFDTAMLVTPEPEVIDDGKQWKVRFKRAGKYTHYIFPSNPIDVIGWKGDVTPMKLNIRDFRPVNSHRYHLPPSVHTTWISSSYVVCSFVPRPYETSEDALKIPFFHSNVEYEELIFYHEGDFMSRDDVGPGYLSYHPIGFTHGPHPNALKRAFVQDKPMTNEYAVMIDTRQPMYIPKEVLESDAVNKEYWKSWQHT